MGRAQGQTVGIQTWRFPQHDDYHDGLQEMSTYPSPGCVAEVVRVAPCCDSDMVAASKSKYWPNSEALGVAMMTVCHFRLLDQWDVEVKVK
jgi:hypothetical protein